MPTADLLGSPRCSTAPASPTSRSPAAACFDTAVRRGVESPWERIRALKARTKTPLAMALRGRFLVGSRPVGGDFVRRFVASAAESGIDVFRLARPAERRLEPARGGRGDRGRRPRVRGRPRLQPRPGRRDEQLVEQAKKLPELGAARVLLHDPSGALEPHRAQRARRGARRRQRAARRPLLPGRGGQRARGRARGGARRGGPDRLRRLPGRAHAPPRLGRGGSRSALARRSGSDSGVDVDDALARRPRSSTSTSATTRSRRSRRASPCAPRSTSCRRASSPRSTRGLRAHGAADRLDEVLDELAVIRDEAGSPPLAAPIGQILGSQALVHVLSASRYQTVVDELRELLDGRFGTPPGPDRPDGRSAPSRSSRPGVAAEEPAPTSTASATRPRGPRRERGGAAAARALRRGGRAAAAGDPRPRRAARTRCSAAASTRRGPSASARSSASSRSRGSPRSRSRRRARASPCAGPKTRSRSRPPRRAGRRRARGRACRGGSRARRPTARSASRRRWSARSTARLSRARRRSSRRATPSRRARRSASSRR